jgi:hypothetical protein
MTRSRGLRLLPAALLTIAALLTGCGNGSSTPEAGDTPSASAASSALSSSAPTSKAPAPTQAGQVVKVTKYGVSYEVPQGWASIDGTKVVDAQNPVVRSIAHRLGTSPQQVIASFKNSLQSMAVTNHGAVGGILDNVNAVGTPAPSLDDDQIKLQLSTLGARLGSFHHVSTPAGEVTRVAYRWKTSGLLFHGEMLAIDTGDAVVTITVTAHSAASAAMLADQVQASIDRL